jgi:hypothetical protein
VIVDVLVIVTSLALVGVVAYYVAQVWIAACELLAGSGCLCRKGAIHPDCPQHGWTPKAAHLGEDAQATKGTGTSVS